MLNGFQQVEDELATLACSARRRRCRTRRCARRRWPSDSALAQYRGGTATYLAVVTAQTLSLSNPRTAVQLRSRQMTASVALIAAIGGGWSASPPCAARRAGNR